jgi:hypothetical protein
VVLAVLLPACDDGAASTPATAIQRPDPAENESPIVDEVDPVGATATPASSNDYKTEIEWTFGPGGTYDVPAEMSQGTYRVDGWYWIMDADGTLVHQPEANWYVGGDCPDVMIVDDRAASVDLRDSSRAAPLDPAKPLNVAACRSGSYLVGVDLTPGRYEVDYSTGDGDCFVRFDDAGAVLQSDCRIGTDPIVMAVEPTDYVAAADGPLTRLPDAEPVSGASTSTD